MVLYPPYWHEGWLLGAVEYYRVGQAPADPDVWYCDGMLRWEVAYVGLTLAAALIAFRSCATRFQRICLFAGLALELLFFLWTQPLSGRVLAAQFTWFGLDAMGVVVLVTVLLPCFWRDRAMSGAR